MVRNKQSIIVCLLALIVGSVSIGVVGAIAPGARLRLEPADLVVNLNETFVVRVVIEEATNLGAFQFDLTYDPAILQVQEATLGNFLGSTDRSALPVGPDVNNVAGRTAFGAASFGSGPGPNGVGVLASITCIARGRGSTLLGLQEVQVLDTALNVQPITVEDGRVMVVGAEGQAPAAEYTGVPKAGGTPIPAATAMPSPAAMPTAIIPVPTPAGWSNWVMSGLLLVAVFVAIAAVIVLRLRPKD